MIKPIDKKRIAMYFEDIGMKTVIISKIYSVTPTRIRQILIEVIGKKKYKKIRKLQIKENDLYDRYHNDPEYRKLCIDRAKKRYRKLKK